MSNKAVCEYDRVCLPCNTNTNCGIGRARDICLESQNSGSTYRIRDAQCLDCKYEACAVDQYSTPCTGKGFNQINSNRNTNPLGFNVCNACSLLSQSTCASGLYLKRCLAGGFEKNACHACSLTPCTKAARGNSLPDNPNGYTLQKCKDNQSGQLQDATCKACIQNCVPGQFRPKCPGNTYDQEPAGPVQIQTLRYCPRNVVRIFIKICV